MRQRELAGGLILASVQTYLHRAIEQAYNVVGAELSLQFGAEQFVVARNVFMNCDLSVRQAQAKNRPTCRQRDRETSRLSRSTRRSPSPG